MVIFFSGVKTLKKDFLELFDFLQTTEVYEPDLYELLKEADSLIKTKNRNSVPNTLRKFYECILYKCAKENVLVKWNSIGSKNTYKAAKKRNEDDNISVMDTTKEIFSKDRDFENKIRSFVYNTNKYSHCEGTSYTKITKSIVYNLIERTIDIWNWYAKNIRCLDNKYIISEKFDIPDSDKDILDMNNLEDDILQTINEFIEDNIYCTYKTIYLFLLGDKIPQTEFKKLTERELFGKYSKNKFSASEYEMALKSLIYEEKIIQIDAYYHPFNKNMTVFDKWKINLETQLYKLKNKFLKFKIRINKKDIEILSKAIAEGKQVKLKYYKRVANTNKKEVTERILTPVAMVPKEHKDDVITSESKVLYPSETLFYLKAYQADTPELKTFRLDMIKCPRILK